MLYYTVLYYTILYSTMLYIPYHNIPYCCIPYTPLGSLGALDIFLQPPPLQRRRGVGVRPHPDTTGEAADDAQEDVDHDPQDWKLRLLGSDMKI